MFICLYIYVCVCLCIVYVIYFYYILYFILLSVTDPRTHLASCYTQGQNIFITVTAWHVLKMDGKTREEHGPFSVPAILQVLLLRSYVQSAE